MQVCLVRILPGFCAVMWLATALLAAETGEPVIAPAPTVAATDTDDVTDTEPQPDAAAETESPPPAFRTVKPDHPQGGVMFRPPKRPSQVKAVEADASETAENNPQGAEPEAETPLPSAGEAEVPRELPASDAETTAQPAADADAEIGTMSFNGIEPGKATVAELKQAWGEPESATSDDGLDLLTFALPPFKKIDVTVYKEVVTSIVVYLDPPMLPADVAGELKLLEFVGVPVPDAQGQLLGQAYPERGVLFGFISDAKAPHVAQIVVEPISADPFVLRVLYDFDHRYAANLKDLDVALTLSPDDAQTLWVKSCVLAETGRYQEALTNAQTAVRLDADTPVYALQVARCLTLAGRYDEAMSQVEKLVSAPDLADHVAAQAQCELGRLWADRPEPDYTSSIAHYQEAIKLASPLVTDTRFEIRRAAKQALVDANAGIGCAVALGNYQRKGEVTAKWLDRAGVYADQYLRGDNGPKDLTLKVLACRMAAYTGMGDEVDPTKVADAAIQEGRRLIAWSQDPLFKQNVEWIVGLALMDAVRVEHARGQHLQSLRYAEMAAAVLESAAPQRQLAPRETFALGRFYFLAGAVEAVNKKDHDEAAKWYARAVPRLTDPSAVPSDSLTAGRMGEWLVSIGVTLWQVDDKQQAVELTQRGADLIKQAVSKGSMTKPALSVPYANLASMHRALGDTEKADDFATLAKSMETADKGIQLR